MNNALPTLAPRQPGAEGPAPAAGVVFIAAMVLMAFALACRLATPGAHPFESGAFAAKLLGVTRGEVSGQFFSQADYVFHKGIYAQSASRRDWFAGLKRAMIPRGHCHLHEEGILEIMPWLYFATRADPHNMEAYAVAAYWLAGEAGRPDLAERVLSEALRNNPSDYRAYMEKGIFALKSGDYPRAARYLDRALQCVPAGAGQGRDAIAIDLASVLTYRGLLYEIEERPVNAMECYRAVIAMFPGREGLVGRVREIEQKGRPDQSPKDLAAILLRQRRHVCSEGEQAQAGEGAKEHHHVP